MNQLNIGDKAPTFICTSDDGSTFHLQHYKGKKIILFFYPKDNTPACTAECCNLNDNLLKFQADKIILIGVSTDSIKSHLKFKSKYNLSFPLLSDPELVVHHLYGTWGDKKLFGREYQGTLRTTFIINELGTIESIIKKVDTKIHTQQIFNILNK